MQEWKRLVLKPLVALILLLIGLVSAQIWFIPNTPGEKKIELSALGGGEEFAAKIRHEKSKESNWNNALSDSLLLDSILTIVQNYYVDESRVQNKDLLETILKTLDEQDVIRLSFKGENTWIANHANDRISFLMSERYSFDELVRDCLRLSQFLEKTNQKSAKSKVDHSSGARLVLNAMLSGLDPHSNLLSTDEYRDLRQGTEGSFGGLGVVVGMHDDVLTVVKPLPKSPAARAGVSRFDRIMKIDDKSTFGTTLDDLIQYMRGEPGTKVRLSLLREGDLAPKSIFLTREIIQVDSVEWKLIDAAKGKIFYALIDSFSSRTASELRDALIKAQQGKSPIAGVVLDLRSNPGGLLDQAVKVADLFLDEGKILTTRGRSRELDSAKKNITRFDYPIVVLTDGDTASASEIVAGALRDHGRALIIGEPSFGKGSVQTVFELPGEQALKLTVARYYTPSGVSIQNVGIMPDIWLQPVFKDQDNVNLLGEYRYKSERFLDHSLDQGKIQIDSNDDLKAFYLVRPEKIQKEKMKDVPLEFASQFLGDLAKRDGLPFPVERLRSGYWKASASGLIKKSLADLDKRSTDWLDKEFKIDWSEDAESLSWSKDLQFVAKIPKRIQMREGSTVEVPWQVRNAGRKSINRVSVYLSGIQSLIGTNEVLVGKIAPGETVKGVMKFDLTIDAKEGTLRMRAGVARGGWPIAGKEHNFSVELLETQEPDINLDIYLSDEKSGLQTGILEPGENARIKVIMKNASSVLASNVELKLVNLAGSQIKIDHELIEIGRLAPGESKSVFVAIKASSNLMSEEFQFGALVKSREHVLASKTHFSLPSIPNARVSKSNVLVGPGPWKEN